MKAFLLSAALAMASINALAGGAQWNPYQGVYGGWDFDNGSTARYNPFQGPYGGWDFSDGSSAQYNPFKGPYGGWDFDED